MAAPASAREAAYQTVLGLVTMVLFKPRAWCVYCPMGTMTQGICKLRHRGKVG